MKDKLANIRYRLVKIFHNHQAFIVLCVVLLVMALAILRVNQFNTLPLDQGRIDSEKATLSPVRFDASAIEKMEALQESNVAAPGTELPADRQNPFSE